MSHWAHICVATYKLGLYIDQGNVGRPNFHCAVCHTGLTYLWLRIGVILTIEMLAVPIPIVQCVTLGTHMCGYVRIRVILTGEMPHGLGPVLGHVYCGIIIF